MPDIETTSTVDFEAEAKKLRRHFSFTESDLSANQRGVLSEKQLERIAKDERGGKRLGFIIGGGLFLGGIAFILLVFFWMSNLENMQDLFWISLLWGGMGLLLGLIALAMAGAGVYLIVSQLRGKAPNTLMNVRGKAQLVKGHTSRRYRVYYDLHINEQEFDGDGTIDKAIIQGAEYVVYYLDGVGQIMSVELISEAG